MVNILLGVTGSVASIKAHQIVQQLREELSSDTLNIRIICTDHAKHFLERQILKELGVEVVDDSCEWTTWKTRGDPVLHIELTKWADLIVVAPLDALTLSKLANAHCDNLLTCVLIAWPLHEKPVLVCPSMNTNMWKHPGTQGNLITIKAQGLIVLGPISKRLMCGDTGLGAMEEPRAIAQRVKQLLTRSPFVTYYQLLAAGLIGFLLFKKLNN